MKMKMKMKMFFFSDWNITCEFNVDMCQWTTEFSDPEGQFVWRRKNGAELVQEGVGGPREDHLQSETGYFIHVSSDREMQAEAFTTKLVSPYFVGQDHPIECVGFWFSLEVIDLS